MVDMVPEARKWHKAHMDAYGQESEFAKMVRLMADDIEGWERVFMEWSNANLSVSEIWRNAHPNVPAPSPGRMIVWLCDELKRINTINRHLVDDWNRQLVRTAKLETELRQAKCVHDYEAEDDKGWTCKKCGHGT